MMKPLVLECFGLPGAGKTTIVHELILRLTEHGWTVSDADNLGTVVSSLDMVRRATLAVPYVTLTDLGIVARALWSSRPLVRERINRVARLPLREAYLQLFVDTFDGDAVCLDQWIVQAIWSASVGLPNALSPSLSDFLKRAVVKRPRLFVYSHIDVEETARRIVNRSGGKSRFDGLQFDEIVRRLRAEEGHMEYLLAVVESSGAEVLRLDGSDPVGVKVDKTIEWIMSRGNK